MSATVSFSSDGAAMWMYRLLEVLFMGIRAYVSATHE